MSLISAGGLTLSLHMITGALAIGLMFVHAIWATYVLKGGDPLQIETFHKYSIMVWVFWLLTYISGLIMGMFPTLLV